MQTNISLYIYSLRILHCMKPSRTLLYRARICKLFKEPSAGILEQSMWARNRVGIPYKRNYRISLNMAQSTICLGKTFIFYA
jgi:hypothetical protein